MSGFLLSAHFDIVQARPVNAASFTLVHRTPLDAARVQLQGAARLPFAKGLFQTTASSAVIESEAVEAPLAFDDLVGSWNADVPPGAMLELQAQVRTEEGWSGWYNLAVQKGSEHHSVERQEDAAGFVDVDTLKLKRKASAFRYRFLLSAPRRPVVVRLAAVSVCDDAPSLAPAFAPGPWVRELRVRPRSQMEEQEKHRHDICSPTSLAMVLDYWGARRPTAEVAALVQDGQTKIFGHWPFNAAVAGSFGLEAHVARLDGLDALQEQIARGRPVVVSVTFGLGDLSGAPLRRTKGHLMVVAGFTPRGDIIAMDPAAPSRASARRVYDRAEFHKIWRVNKRGLAYLIGPMAGSRAVVGAAVADLRSKPRAPKRTALDDAEHLSQVLYGEPVTLVEARGDWVRVRADEQPSESRGAWQGYCGWTRADALLSMAPQRTDVVVRTRQALLQRGPDMVILSVGTRLRRESQARGLSYVRLLDGTLAEVDSDSLYVPAGQTQADARSQIVRTAELFLGTSYYWGGRSGVQPELSIGVDCSGLVSLAYRVEGIDLPRDSRDQRLRARPVKRKDLAPGDLVFLTEPGRPKRISHVMIYTGGDGVIESRKSSGRVLRSSFKERFGMPLTQLENGAEVTDYSFTKAKKRRLYFGSYFTQ